MFSQLWLPSFMEGKKQEGWDRNVDDIDMQHGVNMTGLPYRFVVSIPEIMAVDLGNKIKKGEKQDK